MSNGGYARGGYMRARCLLSLAVLAAWAPAGLMGAERIVLGEDFTANW